MRTLQSNYLIFLALGSLLTCCGENEKRAKELEKKEQKLRIWEQQLSLREQALIKRELIIDSLTSNSHTRGVVDPKLVGDWRMTMVCTETTCEGSAIGDTKTEHWNISYQNNRVVARVTANKQLIRTYSGFFKENTLELTADQAPESETQMRVVLNPSSEIANLMEGERVINQGGKCKIVYQLKAEKL
jgi:hypothetical protein